MRPEKPLVASARPVQAFYPNEVAVRRSSGGQMNRSVRMNACKARQRTDQTRALKLTIIVIFLVFGRCGGRLVDGRAQMCVPIKMKPRCAGPVRDLMPSWSQARGSCTGRKPCSGGLGRAKLQGGGVSRRREQRSGRNFLRTARHRAKTLKRWTSTLPIAPPQLGDTHRPAGAPMPFENVHFTDYLLPGPRLVPGGSRRAGRGSYLSIQPR